jgi:tetraacyldisaccharide 4'-kinase
MVCPSAHSLLSVRGGLEHAVMSGGIWYGNSALDKLARLPLIPVSWLYSLGWSGYVAAYNLGLKRSKEPRVPVVCVGNLAVGGTGKTPVTVHVARLLQELGREVVISCSGYGSGAAAAAQLAPAGELRAQDWGDEPAVLREELPEVPLIVGRRRVLAAEICHDHFPNAVMLMDDGFQHLPLRKHLSIVLHDPKLLPNRFTLPAGPLREPEGGLKRAEVVLPGTYRVDYKPLNLTPPPASAQVSVLCALGRPERFVAALEASGLTVAHQELRRDHDPLDDPHLLKRLPEQLPIVVTLKDWVKLRERRDVWSGRISIARREATIEPSASFREFLLASLEAGQSSRRV